jgi:hypothetical protein
MKKLLNSNKLVYILLNIISISLILSFIIFLSIDYYNYSEFSSAPFYVFIISRAINFLLPSIVLLIFARYFKKRKSTE